LVVCDSASITGNASVITWHNNLRNLQKGIVLAKSREEFVLIRAPRFALLLGYLTGQRKKSLWQIEAEPPTCALSPASALLWNQ
jgi:hypothetical protein